LIFIDSNIPLYLVGRDHPNKGRARELLDECFDAEKRLVTSTEVLQEILHRYVAIDRRNAIKPAFDLVNAIADEVYSIEPADVEQAREVLENHPDVSARDALHVAVMQRRGIGVLLSFDGGFDCIPDIARLS